MEYLRKLVVVALLLGWSMPLAAVDLNLEAPVVDRASKRTTALFGGALVVADLKSGQLYEAGDSVDEAVYAASTFKLISAYHLLDSGKLVPNQLIDCSTLRDGKAYYRCWKREGHGLVDITEALAVSCNMFFYRSHDLDTYHGVVALALSMGYVMPDEECLVVRPDIMVHGDELKITPRNQMRILLSVVPGEVHPALQKLRHPGMNPAAIEVMSQGMRKCVETGTGKICLMPGFPVAGKTGSWKGTRWFLSYAPADQPRVAVVAYCTGGSLHRAVSMARSFYQKIQTNAPQEQTRRRRRRGSRAGD